MGPRFRVSSERLEKSGIEPTTPGLDGEQLNHYATEASIFCSLHACYRPSKAPQSSYIVKPSLNKISY